MSKYNTYAEINLKNLAYNFEQIKRLAGTKKIICVIKADAYGHGAVHCAKLLADEHCSYFAVASIDEAKELRTEGISTPILVLGYVHDDRIKEALEYNLTLSVYDYEFALKVSDICVENNLNAKFHIKVNTGMNRLGFKPEEAAEKILDISKLDRVEIEGIFSHYATADEDDLSYSKTQFAIFKDLIEQIKHIGLNPPYIHISNSASIVNFQDDISTAIRPGIILYGIVPFKTKKASFKPVMSLYSKIASVSTYKENTPISYARSYYTKSERTIATVCAGYADGYFRALSNKSEVYVNGERAHCVGTICMDMFMIDVTHIDNVKKSDKVELFGQNISAEEIARLASTIPYEVLCSVSKRVKREYIK